MFWFILNLKIGEEVIIIKEENRRKTMVNEFSEMAGLGINDQEIANGLGVDPKLLGELKEQFTKGPSSTFGNVFSGYYSNNWVQYKSPDKK